MPTVETVNGPVDIEQLGMTLIHEHFQSLDESARFQFPHLYDDEGIWDRALADAKAVISHGVRTVCEPSACFLSRDARFSKRVADESGLQIVPGTGIYSYDYLPQVFLNRDEDGLAYLFVHDVEQGIQGTAVKAAFMKCAADTPGVTPNVEKVHRGVARASIRPAGRSWRTRIRRAARASSRCASSRTRESTPSECRSPTPATRTTWTTSRS